MSLPIKYRVFVQRKDDIHEVEFVSYMGEDAARRRALVRIGVWFEDFDTEMEVVDIQSELYFSGRP